MDIKPGDYFLMTLCCEWLNFCNCRVRNKWNPWNDPVISFYFVL